MPEAFKRCINAGGRVRTIKPKPGKYMHVCFDKQDKSYVGEVKEKKHERKE